MSSISKSICDTIGLDVHLSWSDKLFLNIVLTDGFSFSWALLSEKMSN